MGTILDQFAATHPDQVVRRSGELFFAPEAVLSVIAEAQRLGVKVLGLEGFLIADEGTFPALGRLADFSDENPNRSCQRASEPLTGPWLDPPTVQDQMASTAQGRYMVSVVLDEND